MDYTNLGVYVNKAMGLDIGNRFGSRFIEDYFVERHRDTSISNMGSWARQLKFHSGNDSEGYKQFTITHTRHAILTSILDIMLLMSGGGDE